MPDFIFKKTLIIGVGLIGSSLARGLKNKKISNLVIGYDKNNEVKVANIALVDRNSTTRKGPKNSVRYSNKGNNII